MDRGRETEGDAESEGVMKTTTDLVCNAVERWPDRLSCKDNVYFSGVAAGMTMHEGKLAVG